MPLHPRYINATASTYGFSIERLSDQKHFDFSAGVLAFVTGTPAAPIQDLTAGTGIYTGLYSFDMPNTPNTQFLDGDFGVYIHNVGSSNAILVGGTVTFINGDAATFYGLNGVASNFNVAGTIGAKINTAASVSGQTFPTNFANMVIDAATGGVTVKTNLDKLGYSLNVVSGSGSRVVNQNTGGTDNLRATTAGGVGLGGVTIYAYLQADYAAGNVAAQYVQASATTGSDGRWLMPMMLNTGSYTLVFGDPGVEQTSTVNITVS